MAALYPQLMGGSAETGGKRADAVLVFGSTGKMGRAIVREVSSASTYPKHFQDVCHMPNTH